jgi:DTW domain-containing protein YfiP
MHNRETFKTTNTARLAALALKNSEVFVRGLPNERLNLHHLVNDKPISLLLTLSDKAQTLTPDWVEKLRTENPGRSFRLVVPDGNWGQASRMTRREPILSQLPWVKLPPGPLSRYRLRYEHHVEGLSTLEAIGRAMTLLDGNKRTEEHLLHLFELMVERTLSSRPLMRAAKSPGT